MGSGTADPDAMPILALRRWYESLSLSSPRLAPSWVPLWVWLGGLAAALVLAMAHQGPGKALRQFFDLRGHARVIMAALVRLRNAGRMVAILCGAVVLAWTAGQFAHFNDPARLIDLQLFASSKSLPELAAEQGVLAGMVPLRDLVGLGDLILLLIAATILVFKLSADRWGGMDNPYVDLENPLPRWTTPCWVVGWTYVMYRLASLIVPNTFGLPLSMGLFPEVLIVPLIMAFADGLLLAWVLVELRNATLLFAEEDRLNVREVVAVWPAAVLACAAIVPARYVATGAWLFTVDLPGLAGMARGVLSVLILGWGLVYLQGAAILFAGMAGAAAWCGGSSRACLSAYRNLQRAEGGRIVAILALMGLTACVPVGLAYLLVLSLPRQPWVLAAADSYAHYATLPIGLICLSALVELGLRALPRAAVAEVEVLLEVEVGA